MLRFSRFAALIGALLMAAPLAAQPLVYVTDPPADRVYVINSGTNTIFGILPGINQARAIAISPDATRVFVAGSDAAGAGIVVVANGVRIARGAPNQIIATIRVGGDPIAVAYDARAGLLYVADAASAEVKAYELDEINPEHPEATATYAGAASLEALALAPDGKSLALASARDDSVTLYDLRAIEAGRTGKTVLALGSAPQAVRYAPRANKLWIATADGFSVYTPATANLTHTDVARGTSSIAVAPRTGKVYFGAASGRVYVHTIGTPGTTTLVAEDPVSGLTLSADGTRLYAVQHCSGCGLAVINTVNGRLLGRIHFGVAPRTAGDFAGPGDIYAPNGASEGEVGEQLSASVQASDRRSRPLGYSLIKEPVKGQLDFNASGDLTYTPPAGYSGVQAFVWQAGAAFGVGAPVVARSRPITRTLNIHPAISSIGDQGGRPGGTLGPLAFSVAGTQPLEVELESSNENLVAAGAIAISAGCGTTSMSCSLTVPIKNVDDASTEITLTVTGPAGLSSDSDFTVTVGSGGSGSGGAAGSGALALFALGGLMLLAGSALARRRKSRRAQAA